MSATKGQLYWWKRRSVVSRVPSQSRISLLSALCNVSASAVDTHAVIRLVADTRPLSDPRFGVVVTATAAPSAAARSSSKGAGLRSLALPDWAPGTSMRVKVEVTAADGVSRSVSWVEVLRSDAGLYLAPQAVLPAGLPQLDPDDSPDAEAVAVASLADPQLCPLSLTLLSHPLRLTGVAADQSVAPPLSPPPHHRRRHHPSIEPLHESPVLLSYAAAKYLTQTCKQCPFTRRALRSVDLVPDPAEEHRRQAATVQCPHARYGCEHTAIPAAHLAAHLARGCRHIPYVDPASELVAMRAA